MKIKPLVFLTCVLVAAGCASDKGSDQPGNAQKQSEKTPEVGMTKDEVIALYGKTDNVQASSEGETWIYNLNLGEAFIPWNFGYRPKMRIVNFNKEGKVASWSYSK